jgi:hypothetical protein
MRTLGIALNKGEDEELGKAYTPFINKNTCYKLQNILTPGDNNREVKEYCAV